MRKYKICEYQNGLGEHHWRIKIWEGWWWPIWQSEDDLYYGSTEYKSRESAQDAVDFYKERDLKNKITRITCEDV